ncbi:MAG: FAD binding domain-containing protein [Gammaproteobacteria bacterium]|nr:FAD binding domain-containing protein [Gammaproteobacteria bacterium]
MLTCDDYRLPRSLKSALEAWSKAPEGSRLVAGATDTLPWARQGRAGDIVGDVHVPLLVDVTEVSALDSYRLQDDGRIRLGANLVFQQFLEDENLARYLPHMPPCALWFADDQIRRQATIAGNIVNASPAADGIPPLVALNAEVEIASLHDQEVVHRNLPLVEFVTGPGRTQLQPGEIVTAVTCDTALGYGGAFEKVGHRRSLVISIVCTSCCLKPSQDHKVFDDVRLALGGVGPVPMRLDDVETFLRGQTISPQVIAAASEIPLDRVASRTRREYRRDVIRGFVDRSIRDALARCGISLPPTHRPA